MRGLPGHTEGEGSFVYLGLAVVVVDGLVEQPAQLVGLPLLSGELGELAEHLLDHGLGEEDGVLERVDAERLRHVHRVDHTGDHTRHTRQQFRSLLSLWGGGSVHGGDPAHGVELHEVRDLASGLAGNGVVVEGLDDEAAGLEHAADETLLHGNVIPLNAVHDGHEQAIILHARATKQHTCRSHICESAARHHNTNGGRREHER